MRVAGAANAMASVEVEVAPALIVEDAIADDYFATRPRESRIGAWASQQSRPLESRLAFEKAVARFTAKVIIWFLLISVGMTLIYKVVPPPITPTRMAQQPSGSRPRGTGRSARRSPPPRRG